MDRFFWISQQEIDALLETRGNDWRVYLALRHRADFTHGRFTHYSAKRITAASIGRDISLPAAAGVPALAMTRKDVSRALERLIKCGLIDDMSRENGFLRLRLPHVAASAAGQTQSQNRLPQVENEIASGLSRTEPATKPSTQGASGGNKGRLPHEESQDAPRASRTNAVKSAEIIALHGFAGNDSGDVNNKNKTLSNTPCVHEGGNHSPSAKKTYSPASRACDEKPENPETEKQVDRFRDLVIEEGEGIIQYPDTSISRKIYASWVRMNPRECDVREAVRSVLEHPEQRPTPTSIDIELRSQIKVSKSTKGRLAL